MVVDRTWFVHGGFREQQWFNGFSRIPAGKKGPHATHTCAIRAHFHLCAPRVNESKSDQHDNGQPPVNGHPPHPRWVVHFRWTFYSKFERNAGEKSDNKLFRKLNEGSRKKNAINDHIKWRAVTMKPNTGRPPSLSFGKVHWVAKKPIIIIKKRIKETSMAVLSVRELSNRFRAAGILLRWISAYLCETCVNDVIPCWLRELLGFRGSRGANRQMCQSFATFLMRLPSAGTRLH